MIRKNFRMVICLLLLLLISGQSGCVTLADNPRAQLLASQKIFVRTVDSLTVLLKADKFSAEETKRISTLIHIGDNYLDEWDIAIQQGRASPDMFATFNSILKELIAYYDIATAREGVL